MVRMPVVDGVEAALPGILLSDGQGDSGHPSCCGVAEVIGAWGDGTLGRRALGCGRIRGPLAPGPSVRVALWRRAKWRDRVAVPARCRAGGVLAVASPAVCGFLAV